jgi:hypothetical protein
MRPTGALAGSYRIDWRHLHACSETLHDGITKFVLINVAFIYTPMNMYTLLVAYFNVRRQVPMGVGTDVTTTAAIRHVYFELRPKTLPIILQPLFIDGAVVVGMIEEVDESFASVFLDVCMDHVVCTTHHFGHDTVWFPEEATC